MYKSYHILRRFKSLRGQQKIITLEPEVSRCFFAYSVCFERRQTGINQPGTWFSTFYPLFL